VVVSGFCNETFRHGFVLMLGAAEADESNGSFADKMMRLVSELRVQQAEAAKLDAAIAANLKELRYGG
jgi:type I restriction enzyme M protein